MNNPKTLSDISATKMRIEIISQEAENQGANKSLMALLNPLEK